ncbi:response regulator [Cohnella fermenti]|uniref:Response regulator n=1 Tax=Cohnella fermenti TaxID=2565925 RepID=A0A4S4BIH2_9BACL|nr:response regulator [Cohnella fermenti]THF74416.1 response regulator [Cohnella fermenti]
MLKVLIAEDEMLVRIGLKNSIPWDTLDMEVIADVANGQSAWEVYERERPDIVLTDIKMPDMDGLQLISRIREQDADTKIIILTVYEEFDLLHRALKLNVADYILKLKMSIEDMVKVLGKIREECMQERSRPIHDMQDTVKLDMEQLKEHVVKDYLFYGRYTEREFAARLEQLRVRLQSERLVVCVMAIEQFELVEARFGDWHGKLIRFSIVNMISEILAGNERGEVIHDKEERYMLLFSFSDVSSEHRTHMLLQEILEHIQGVLKSYLNAAVTFGVSTQNSGYGSLKKMYGECIRALDKRYLIGNERFIRWDDQLEERLLASAQASLTPLIELAGELDERFQREVEAGIRMCLGADTLMRMDIELMFMRWIHWPTVNRNDYQEDLSGIALQAVDQIRRCATLADTIAVFRRYLSEIKERKERQSYLSMEVAAAVKFIEANYSKDISLQQVAEHVQLSSSYLSSLFRKELQRSFIDYLNRYRVDRAKELLVNTYLKSYEIAERVGYQDDSYFSRIFKRETGLRPNEFRKQWHIVGKEESGDESGSQMV